LRNYYVRFSSLRSLFRHLSFFILTFKNSASIPRRTQIGRAIAMLYDNDTATVGTKLEGISVEIKNSFTSTHIDLLHLFCTCGHHGCFLDLYIYATHMLLVYTYICVCVCVCVCARARARARVCKCMIGRSWKERFCWCI